MPGVFFCPNAILWYNSAVITFQHPGGVSEWSIEIVLKTIRGDEPLEGSNPSPTAISLTGSSKMRLAD